FSNDEGQPHQVIAEPSFLSISVADLSGFNKEERRHQVACSSNEVARQPFDLSRGPLFRTRLLKLAEDDHIILLTMHHIVSDAWSMNILMHEFSTLYAAYSVQQPSPLTELSIQYADFAVWQREWLRGAVLESGLAYWREQLAGDLPVLELPTDRPRPVVQSYRGAYHSFSFPDQLSQALKQLSRRHRCTLFMTMLAGVNAVLYRYTGQEDIIVGTDIAGRNHAGIEPLIGFFVNQLVLRTDLSGELHFLELLKRVRSVALGAYSHQDVPFEKLVEELQPERDLGRAPLFQTKLVLQNAPTEALDQLPGLQIQRLGGESGAARFDLTIGLVEAGETMGGTVAYSTDLFDAATIQRLLSHLENMLSAAVANPERRISELSLLDEAERQQILVEWNDTALTHQRDICVHQLFEAQAEHTPAAAAIFMDDEQVSYAELNVRANQLAHHLRKLGVGPEVLVAICVERSIEMIVALLGVLKAGGAYTPIDSQYPPDRISFMLDDAGISVLLTLKSLVEKLPSHWGYTVCLDADRHALDTQPTENLETSATPDNLAYVIYTSGSSGRPKAVMTEHKALLARLLFLVDFYQLEETDRHLQLAAFGFDVAAEEILAPLTSGGAVVLYSYQQARSGPELLRQGAKIGLSKLTATASYWHQLVDEMGAAQETWPESLRLLVIGGESVSVEKLKVFAAQLKHPVRFLHAYGPTEATIVSTYFSVQLEDGHLNSLTRIPIGRPAGDTTIYLVDRHVQPVPVGVTGEILIGGAALARGYVNRSEVTAERFIPDPFNIKDRGSRLYRTGDFARYLADGTIEFIGREDSQVKVRGYRIELDEINAVLQRHPQVSEAVVVVREEANGERRLVGYVTNGASGSADVAVAELREYLRARLPGYMVPQAVVMLAEMPRTPNGKVDRRALAELEAQPLSIEGYSEPRTAVEELLVNIWSGVLRIEGVSTEQNFFELGGHSLLATQVIARIREVFSVELSLRTLFEQPTVSGLALSIEAALRKESRALSPPLRRVSREQRLPLSFAQQRLWFLAELDPQSTFYNVPTAVRLEGQFNFDALRQALNEIVRRHEVLRTSFSTIAGEPVQIISSPEPVMIVREETEDEETVRRLMNEEGNIPFDLSEGPLLRVKLLRMAEDKHVLLLTLPHIVSDGWSMGVLSKELTALYRSFNKGEESTLPELPIQYADYAVWQREWLQGEVLEGELAYWREQLGGDLPVLELPTDRPRGVLKSYKGASHSLSFSKRTTQSLKELSRAHDCTLFMTVLAAYQTLLYRHSGQEEIIVGSPIAGRNRVEIENLIGFFVNTLVLRTDLRDGPTFVELLKRVREVALGAYAHQQVPFEKLVEELEPQRDLSRSPLFQVMFHLQNTASGPEEGNAETSGPTGLRLSLIGGQIETAKYELSVFLSESDNGLTGSIEYNTDLFDELTIKRLVGHFERLLDGVAVNPEQKIEALPLLSEGERWQLLEEWNDTAVEYPGATSVQELFELQVERTPEAVALVFGGEQLTYAELNARANQLAQHLRALGVGPDVLVGICVERN
ncbi:MAG TPA: amino acid adenylation domain-containing protein, partial [Pyrinomonadaceae bacterium]|nr:amino acid adenylation domain-containing protein [Pyrinomonadaceae bacterium]